MFKSKKVKITAPDATEKKSKNKKKHKKNREKKQRRNTAASVQHKDFDFQKDADKYLDYQLTITQQEFTINNLKKELKKYTKTEYTDIHDSQHQYQRTIKHKDKEIANLRRRLKLAINDYEKVYGYYKKQLDIFKTNQDKWLKKQKSSSKHITKYVFADDIRKIKVRKKGVRVYFNDGEDVVFDEIEVLKDQDHNDDDQYRNLVKNVRQEEIKYDSNDEHQEQVQLDDDDMIILCLNELNARIRDFKHQHEPQYVNKIQERYDALPIYHIDDEFLHRLKSANNTWIKLFKSTAVPSTNKSSGHKGQLGAFFKAQKQMKSGNQPMICLQNNVILNNINHHKKPSNISYAKHLQSKVDKSDVQQAKMAVDSKNIEADADLDNLASISVPNGWFTAQFEMLSFKQQPSICIKNNIALNNIQKQTQSALTANDLQNRLNSKVMKGSKRRIGHSKMIEMDKGDSSEEDENGMDLYNKNVRNHKQVQKSNMMNQWYLAQVDIDSGKQPTICIQNNIILNNIQDTRQQKKGKKKAKALRASVLQKRLNETTSSGLSKSTVDLSDDEEEEEEEEKKVADKGIKNTKERLYIHSNAWYYKNKQRTNFIKSVKIEANSDSFKLLKEAGVYLNRLIPTSKDYHLVKQYFPIYNQPHDIIAACFDGVLLSVLINFIDPDLIDIRALNLPQNKLVPISKDAVIENMFVVKQCIASLDLHEFPDFGIDFETKRDDIQLFCWYNSNTMIDILLLIIMHQYMGLLNKKINIFKYPELFRLCQTRQEKKNAQKCSCKEWLLQWIQFVKQPKINRHSQNNKHHHHLLSSIDLAGFHKPQISSHISWDAIKLLDNGNDEQRQKYVWETDYDFHDDIQLIQKEFNVSFRNINTIAKKDDLEARNYLLQFIYLTDIFVFGNKIEKLSPLEQKSVTQFLKRKEQIDVSFIAWINAFKFVNEEYEFQYVNNMSEDIDDGVILLKLLDAIKPGVVNWNKGVRTTAEVRHKFDKLTNCNLVKQICDESFRDIFHLVGMGGNDIVDQNRKYIRSLLFQMQRFHSTKLMAKILFQKRAVTDEELLKWMNNRLSLYKQMVNTMNRMQGNTKHVHTKKNAAIPSFQDKAAVSDCINFCNVVSSINSEWINYQYVNQESECKSIAHKIANARYLLTVLRRLGSDSIFISAKELTQCEHRAVITVSAAIMTLAAQYNHCDQLALFAKTLKQIKAKMRKK